MATYSTGAFTADDVLDLPLPNGVSGYEFVDGQPVPVMPASAIHGEAGRTARSDSWKRTGR